MRLAIMEADKSPVNETETLLVRIQPILDEVRAKLAGQPKRTWEDEKAFMDEGWGEAD